MEDKKVTNSAAIGLRRAEELREYALAAFYPLTHSGDAVHLKRAEDASPVIAEPPLRRRLPDNLEPAESVAKPWKKPWDK
ncbi:MAG: hypothetical protein ACLPTF_07170 [Steroidobacteraceae bacterium]